MYAALVLTKAMEAGVHASSKCPGSNTSRVSARWRRFSLPSLLISADPYRESIPWKVLRRCSAEALLELEERFAYRNFTGGLARSSVLDPDAMGRPFCSGALRKIGGKFCTVLTTSWDTPFTLELVKEIIDPLNWPELCDFFVSMGAQAVLNPDPSRGGLAYSKASVAIRHSGRCERRFVIGRSQSRQRRSRGYLCQLRPGRSSAGRRLQVARGRCRLHLGHSDQPCGPELSGEDPHMQASSYPRCEPTATAALGCGFGWGDAMSQMFGSRPA